MELLESIVEKVNLKIRWLILIMFITALVMFVVSYMQNESGDIFEWWLTGGILTLFLSCYLIYISYSIVKTKNQKNIKSKLTIIFSIMIPFSLLVSIVLGFFSPIIALIGLISFFTLLKYAFKYYRSYSFIEKKGLIKK